MRFPTLCRIEKDNPAKVSSVFDLILHKLDVDFSDLGDAKKYLRYTGLSAVRGKLMMKLGPYLSIGNVEP